MTQQPKPIHGKKSYTFKNVMLAIFKIHIKKDKRLTFTL